MKQLGVALVTVLILMVLVSAVRWYFFFEDDGE